MEPNALYLVATPIGNLSDLSFRALEILKTCDLIAAEDTRVTAKLCAHYGIRTPVIAYHEHNKRAAGETILTKLAAGETIALVTDAGTPAVSDPGEDLVKACIERGIGVIPIPGACAAISALIVSGFDTARFTFEGFLPQKKKDLEERLFRLSRETRTAILYEAPHRLCDTLFLLANAVPDRRMALCRELTKLNEEVLRGTVRELYERMKNTPVRGEFVLVLEGAAPAQTDFSAMSVEEHFESYLKQGYSKKDAVRLVAADRKVPKNEIYMQFLHAKDEKESES